MARDETAKDDLLAKYGREILKLLALLGAHANAKDVEITLGDYLCVLESIIESIAAMHSVDKPEIYPNALDYLIRSLIEAKGELIPADTRKMLDNWTETGAALYQQLLSESQKARLARARFELVEETEPTKH